MIEDNKTKIILGLLIVIIIFVCIFAAMAFLNRAKLTINAEPSYVALVSGHGAFECTLQTCEIDLSKGDFNVTLEKDGYKTINFEISLGYRSKLIKDVTFEFIPYISEIPKDEGEKIFEEGNMSDAVKAYLKQEEGKKQALYVKSNGEEKLISYFNIPIKDHDLEILSDTKVMVISHDEKDSVYLVDTAEKSRKKIFDSATEISGVECSSNAKWCLFESDKTSLVNTETNAVKDENNLNLPLTQMAWGNGAKLFLISQYEAAKEAEKSELFYIQKFDPETNGFETILVAQELQKAPNNVKIADNEKEIYMESGGKYFVAKF